MALRKASLRCDFSHGSKIEALERELRQTAAPAIDAFILELQDLSEAERNTEIVNEEAREWDARHVMQLFRVVRSNKHSIARRGQAIYDAIQSAQELKLSKDRDIPARLDEIRNAIPPVVMEAV